MRVMFISTPGVGHTFPMVPLAWAFRSAGHEVLFATSGQSLSITNAGVDVVDLTPEFGPPAFWQPMMIRIAKENPELAEQMAAMRNGKVSDLRTVAGFLSKLSGVLADGAIELAHDWQPDLLVQSRSQGSGLVVAAKLGIPLVDHGIGISRTPDMHELHRRNMADVFDRHGVVALPERRIGLDVAPPSVIEGEPEGWPMRFVPYNGGAVLPDWLAAVPDRPRVAVTLGSVSALGEDGIATLRQLIATASGADAEFVFALPDVDLDALGELPANVRVAGWLPLAALLPGCAALIHHGGGSTTLTAFDAGVPQLVLPDGADRHISAAAVRRRGTGLVAEQADRELIEAVLSDAALRTAATEVRAEIRAMSTPAAVAERLVAERLVAEAA
ncbi:MAG: nucleotide disphospho-sugar-binding domain-containing protein [Micromonosporaceae bacterium]